VAAAGIDQAGLGNQVTAATIAAALQKSNLSSFLASQGNCVYFLM
jgi:hypothetical protein